jgi:hypothetical protein
MLFLLRFRIHVILKYTYMTHSYPHAPLCRIHSIRSTYLLHENRFKQYVREEARQNFRYEHSIYLLHSNNLETHDCAAASVYLHGYNQQVSKASTLHTQKMGQKYLEFYRSTDVRLETR